MTKEQILSDALEIRRQALDCGTYWDLETCIESVMEHNSISHFKVEEIIDLYELRILKLS